LIAGISSVSAAVLAVVDFLSPPVTASPVGRWIGLALIWVGLAIFSADALWRARVDRAPVQSSSR